MAIGSKPLVLGAAISVPDVASLEALVCDGMTLGTMAYVSSLATPYFLVLSSATVDHSAVCSVFGMLGVRWVTASSIIGGFGADTIIDLLNANGADVKALELLASLTTNTAGSEASEWVVKVLGAGAQVSALIINSAGIILPAGLAGITLGSQLLWDDGSGNLRLGARSHYVGNDAVILNPATDANKGVYLDTTVSAGIHAVSGGCALKGASVDAVVALASGGQLWGFGTTGGAVAALKAVAINSSGVIILANSSTPTACLGVTIAGQAGTGPISYVTAGLAPGVLSAATVGVVYYLGATGAITSTKDSTSGHRQIQLGIAVSATDLWVQISDRGLNP